MPYKKGISLLIFPAETTGGDFILSMHTFATRFSFLLSSMCKCLTNSYKSSMPQSSKLMFFLKYWKSYAI